MPEGHLPEPGVECGSVTVGGGLEYSNRTNGGDALLAFGGESPADERFRVQAAFAERCREDHVRGGLDRPHVPEKQAYILEGATQCRHRVVRETPVLQGIPASLGDDGGQ